MAPNRADLAPAPDRATAPARAGLARLLVLTDRHASARPLADVVRAAVECGARAVVLREKDLPAADRLRPADEVRAVLGDGLLVLAGTALPGEALHLSAADAVPAVRPRLLGRSCHDAGEVARAAQQGCDWVSVSPIWTTASKPGYAPALGVPGLAGLLPGAQPAYALGGVTDPARAWACRQAGAYGVGAVGAVLPADRPEQVLAGLLHALGESG